MVTIRFQAETGAVRGLLRPKQKPHPQSRIMFKERQKKKGKLLLAALKRGERITKAK